MTKGVSTGEVHGLTRTMATRLDGHGDVESYSKYAWRMWMCFRRPEASAVGRR